MVASRPGALFTKIACPENRNGINIQYIDIYKKRNIQEDVLKCNKIDVKDEEKVLKRKAYNFLGLRNVF